MTRHALSFAHNPEFKGLIEAVCSGEPVTLVLGAGVSIEAGLPTWSGLLESLGRSIKTPYLNDVIAADEADPARRADLILSVLSQGSGLSDVDRIRTVLYAKTPLPNGVILDSLASLIRALGGRVKIITLNYDDCLEHQLVKSGGFRNSEVLSFGLNEADAWKAVGHSVGILHVHGFITRSPDRKLKSAAVWEDKEPVILSEGEYIKHGALVQGIIRDQAERSHLVFVGTSLSDANITHPLSTDYRSASSLGAIKPAFALMVPDERAAIQVCQSAKDVGSKGVLSVEKLSEVYFDVRCKHIRNTYGISVVRLNSYSQVAQAVNEARLAVENRDKYLDDSEGSSLRYGKRFERIMRGIYSRLKVEPGGVAPGGDNARCLSDELERVVLQVVHPKLQDYIRESFLDQYCPWSLKYYTEEKRMDEAKKSLSAENFGLYLWLRSALGGRGVDRFEVFIAGASSYVRRDGSVMGQRSTVSPRSIYASARSIFIGGPDIQMRPYRHDSLARPGEALDRPWNIYWAMPIAISESDVPTATESKLGRVTVGSIVLQSSAFDRSLQETFDPKRHSLLSLVVRDPECNRGLCELLAKEGARVVSEFSVKAAS